MIDGSGEPLPIGTTVEAGSGGPLIRCGAELAALSERFYGGMFAGAVMFVGVAAFASLAVLPLRDPPPGGLLSLPVVVTGLLVVATPLAVRRAAALQRLLLRRRAAEAAALALAALLIVYPVLTQLWWPSCAIVMALAVLVSPQRALGSCVLVLTTGFVSHGLGGDLDELPGVTIVGLCIGYPLWSVGVAVTSDRLAAHLMRLDVTPARRADPTPPRDRVDAAARSRSRARILADRRLARRRSASASRGTRPADRPPAAGRGAPA